MNARSRVERMIAVLKLTSWLFVAAAFVTILEPDGPRVADIGPSGLQVIEFATAIGFVIGAFMWWGIAGLCRLALDCEEHLRTIKLQSFMRKA